MFPEDKIMEIFSICEDFSKVFDKGKIPSEAATVYLKNMDFYISPQVVPIRVKSTDRQHNVGDVDLWLAPHKGSEATGVVSPMPQALISFGDADNHLHIT